MDKISRGVRFVCQGFRQLLLCLSFCAIACVNSPAFGLEIAAPASLSVETLRGNSASPSLSLYANSKLSNSTLSDAALKTHLPNSTSVLTTHEVSSVLLANGAEVRRYARQLHGIPILNDWAMVVASKHKYIDSIRYNLTQPMSNVSNIERFWPLSDISVLESLGGIDRLNVQPATLKRSWFKNNSQLWPAYTVIGHKVIHGIPAMFKFVLSASDASVLEQYPLSSDLTAYTYKIYADATPALPFLNPHGNTSPHSSGVPGGAPPTTFVAQTEHSIIDLSDSVDDPWLADDATETIGNNADVFFNFTRDTDGTFNFFGDGYGPQYRSRGDALDQDFRAPITDNKLVFDYNPSNYLLDYNQIFDSASDPTIDQIEQINAKQVQAFYLANLLHDLFYDAGFTESAGNAQTSNFGRGGIENDSLIIHINSFTFVSTPEDGTSPVIHLGRSRGGDTSLDTSIFAHEWTHYMYRRLVNPNIPETNQQSRSVNEGWADVVGLLMTLKPADVVSNSSAGFTSTYAIGSYFTQDRVTPTFPDPYFYGIRRYPYGLDNPFLFRHVTHKELLPSGFEYSDYNFRGTLNSQTHTAGEIWANSVWSCFRGVLASRIGSSFDDKRDLLASYIVGGMVLSPPNPTFTESRDGLLAAIKQNSSSDYGLCRERFAGKGMGSGAVSPPRPSKDFSGLGESFENNDLHLSIIRSELKDNRSPLDEDGILDQSESGELVLTLRNTGFEPITQSILKLDSSSADFQRLGPAEVTIEPLEPGQDAQVRLPLRLTHERHFDLTKFSIDVALSGTNPQTNRSYQLTQAHRTHYDLRTQASSLPVGSEFGITMRDWRLNRIQEISDFDPKWEPVEISGNVVLALQEPFIRGRESGIRRALESPWMERNTEPLKLKVQQAYQHEFRTIHIEYTENETDWLPFSATSGLFTGTSPGYPVLLEHEFQNTSLNAGAQFKIRFRTDNGTPIDWQLDDFSISGVVTQPFQEIVPEDGKDTTDFCFPIIVRTRAAAVVCL